MTTPQRAHRATPCFIRRSRRRAGGPEPDWHPAPDALPRQIGAPRSCPSAGPPLGLFGQSAILQLQRTHGNRHVQHLITQAAPVSALQREMEDGDSTGAGPVEGVPVKEEGETATPDLGNVNEDGEIDGSVTSGAVPHVFVNGGKKGSGVVH